VRTVCRQLYGKVGRRSHLRVTFRFQAAHAARACRPRVPTACPKGVRRGRRPGRAERGEEAAEARGPGVRARRSPNGSRLSPRAARRCPRLAPSCGNAPSCGSRARAGPRSGASRPRSSPACGHVPARRPGHLHGQGTFTARAPSRPRDLHGQGEKTLEPDPVVRPGIDEHWRGRSGGAADPAAAARPIRRRREQETGPSALAHIPQVRDGCLWHAAPQFGAHGWFSQDLRLCRRDLNARLRRGGREPFNGLIRIHS